MKSAFFDKLNSRIVMGEYKSAKLIIVVEGIIDGEVFGKIRIPGGPVDVETIESLIKDTIGRKEWRVKTKERSNLTSAKILVREVTKELNAKGYNAIGIQDEDLESVTKYVSSGVFQSSSNHKIFTTFPSTDMENILYPILSSKNRLDRLDIEKGLSNSKHLGIVRISSKIYRKKERDKLRRCTSEDKDNIPGINQLEPRWDKNNRDASLDLQKKYVENTRNIASILKLIINQGRFDPELLSSFADICLKTVGKIEEYDLDWHNFVRGHDLEWFIRFNNGIGTKPLRKILIKNTHYDHLDEHIMFQSIENWRKENNWPRLFISAKKEEE